MAIVNPDPADVKDITGSTLDDAVVQAFIDAANCILTNVEACMIGASISADCQTKAVTFLAAHLMSQSGAGNGSAVKSSEKFENYSVSYITGKYDSSGVLSSSYGNAANALSGGCLQEAEKRPFLHFGSGGA